MATAMAPILWSVLWIGSFYRVFQILAKTQSIGKCVRMLIGGLIGALIGMCANGPFSWLLGLPVNWLLGLPYGVFIGVHIVWFVMIRKPQIVGRVKALRSRGFRRS